MMDCKILLKCDNTMAISNMKKYGTMSNKSRDETAHEIYLLLQSMNSTVEITYISSAANIRADCASRKLKNTLTEWLIDDQTFARIKSLAPEIEFDLFASHLNNKLPQFCSWQPAPGSSHIDAFTFDWNSKICYCFPPFSLLGRCLEEIKKQQVHSIYLLVPWWKTAIWFPSMLEMLVKPPIIFPRKSSRNLRLPWDKNARHPIHHHLRLALVNLSGNYFRVLGFLLSLQTVVQITGESTPKSDTPNSSESGSHIIYKNHKIPIIYTSIK